MHEKSLLPAFANLPVLLLFFFTHHKKTQIKIVYIDTILYQQKFDSISALPDVISYVFKIFKDFINELIIQSPSLRGERI